MSGSLLLIVVVWLLLLAPLMLRKQSPVRRTSQALAKTRVLHKGGTELTNQRRRPLPPEGHYMSENLNTDEDIEFVDAEPEYILIDDTGDAFSTAAAETEAAAVDTEKAVDGAEKHNHNEEQPEPIETVDAEVAGDETASTQTGTPAAVIEGEVVVTVPEADDDSEEYDTDQETAEPDLSDQTAGAEESGEPVAEANAEPELDEASRLRSIPTAYFRGGDFDVSLAVHDEIDEPQALPSAEKFDDSTELSEEDLEYIESRRGRGVYDPVASHKLMQQRLNRRKQVLTVSIALSLITLIASIFVGGWMWLSVLVMFGFTGLYMYTLRKQALEEAKLRRRRLARMRRARLGVRNREDEELGVPDRLKRPGAVIIEADEIDPELENLDYVDGWDYFDDTPGGPAGHDDDLLDTGHIRAV